MATTALVAETLIIGLQTILWILLVVVYTTGVPQIDEQTLKSWDVAIGLYVVAVAYTLGVVFDRLAASILRPPENRLWRYLRDRHPSWIRAESGQHLPEVDELRMELRRANADVADEADELRRPLRITRATVVNVLIIAALLTLSLLLDGQHVISAGFTKSVAVFCWVFSILAVAAYLALEVQYYRRLVVAHRIVCMNPEQGRV